MSCKDPTSPGNTSQPVYCYIQATWLNYTVSTVLMSIWCQYDGTCLLNEPTEQQNKWFKGIVLKNYIVKDWESKLYGFGTEWNGTEGQDL